MGQGGGGMLLRKPAVAFSLKSLSVTADLLPTIIQARETALGSLGEIEMQPD